MKITLELEERDIETIMTEQEISNYELWASRNNPLEYPEE